MRKVREQRFNETCDRRSFARPREIIGSKFAMMLSGNSIVGDGSIDLSFERSDVTKSAAFSEDTIPVFSVVQSNALIDREAPAPLCLICYVLGHRCDPKIASAIIQTVAIPMINIIRRKIQNLSMHYDMPEGIVLSSPPDGVPSSAISNLQHPAMARNLTIFIINDSNRALREWDFDCHVARSPRGPTARQSCGRRAAGLSWGIAALSKRYASSLAKSAPEREGHRPEVRCVPANWNRGCRTRGLPASPSGRLHAAAPGVCGSGDAHRPMSPAPNPTGHAISHTGPFRGPRENLEFRVRRDDHAVVDTDAPVQCNGAPAAEMPDLDHVDRIRMADGNHVAWGEAAGGDCGHDVGLTRRQPFVAW